MRVGIISLYHESNTFMSTATDLEAFRRQMLLSGPAQCGRFAWEHHEITGFLHGLQQADIEPVPLFIASATPGGTIVDAALEELLGLMQRELCAAGALDGILAAPHGAAVSQSIADVDGHWLSLVRQHVGPDVPVIATLDAHANLSRKMIQATDALIAYRTNPHLDQYARGREASELMVRTLRAQVRPVQAAALPPVAINIERQLTSERPCRDLYEIADAMLTCPGVLSNSVLLGFPYADVPEMGSGFVVVTDGDRGLARRLADQMAARLWEGRREFVGKLIGVEQALDMAAQAQPPVCLLDMGDNIGGGSPGDGTVLAHALHRRSCGPSFLCLYDPQSAHRAAQAGPGARLVLTMGGKTDDRHGPPLVASVLVRSIHDGSFTETAVRHGGILSFDMGPTSIVRTDTDLTIMLTSQRTFPASLVQLTSCGLDPAAFRLLVAKGVHAPVAAYGQICRTMIRVDTPGVTTADMAALAYQRRRRPLFPFE